MRKNYALMIKILCLCAVLLLTTATVFAWFIVGNELQIDQDIYVGNFKVEILEQNGQYSGESQVLNITNAYPMSRADALSSDNYFLAHVKNVGNISAIYRLYINFLPQEGIDIDMLASYYRFSMVCNLPESQSVTLVEEEEFSKFEDKTFAAFYNGDGSVKEYTSGGKTVNFAMIDGALYDEQGIEVPGDEVFIRVYIWLAADVQLGDGEDAGLEQGFGLENTHLKFTVKLRAVQSIGGEW